MVGVLEEGKLMDITKETPCGMCKNKCFAFCHIGNLTVCHACFEREANIRIYKRDLKRAKND